MRGIVYLVGAGPGDPGLLTRRGAEILGRADVVLYDRLVHPEVLKLAPNARLVDVGKRPGESGSGQARIHELLVEEAKQGSVVVRLKGGDPFVFGRGGEEAEHLVAHGVPFEVVPGVTSAVAAPAYAGIPLTHREHASWVALATGHEDPTKDASSLDWAALARAPVAVFLMGIERLATIADRLQAEGKPADTPAAVVSSGSSPRQRVVKAPLEKIADAVARAEVSPPAILVVGATVPLAEHLDWFTRRPLANKRVFVTRTRAQAGRLSALLREAGAEALEFPAIRIDPLSDEEYERLDAELAAMSGYEWIAFTSTNAVDAVWTRLTAAGRDARTFAGVRLAAVGPATAEALQKRGIVADLVPPQFTASALGETLGAPEGSGRILLPRAADAPDDLPDALRAAGWSCVSPGAYRTVVDDASVSEGRTAIDEGVDAILFTAGSTVRNFVDLWGPPPRGCLVCCLGPRTAAVAGDLGINVDAVAAEQTLEGLVAALVAAVGR